MPGRTFTAGIQGATAGGDISATINLHPPPTLDRAAAIAARLVRKRDEHCEHTVKNAERELRRRIRGGGLYARRVVHGSAQDVAKLFREEGDEVDHKGLIGICDTRRHLWLLAPGGFGKSVFVLDMVRQIAKDHITSLIVCDTKNSPESITSLDDLLRVAQPPTTLALLSEMAVDRPVFVIVDGINEWSSEVQDCVLDTLQSSLQATPQLRAIVVAREHRGRVRKYGWPCARVCRLSQQQVRDIVEQSERTEAIESWSTNDTRILQIPFYLDLFLTNDDPVPGRGNLIEQFCSHAARQALPDWAPALSDIVVKAMRCRRSIDFKPGDLAGFTSGDHESVASRLLDSAVFRLRTESADNLTDSAKSITFAHHLYPEYFAARWLAAHPDRWTSEFFDVATIHASSFDVLTLTVELLHRDDGDVYRFICAVYDWNYGAAFDMLPFLQTIGQLGAIDADLVVVFVLAQCQKLLDPISSTSIAARERLDSLEHKVARAALACRSAANLHALAKTLLDAGDLNREKWGGLFEVATCSDWTEVDVERLVSDDPVLGWQVSNAIRRGGLDQQSVVQVRALRFHARATVRWRVAHALAGYPGDLTVRALCALYSDESDHWVRYGAARALIECAAESPRHLSTVTDTIRRGLLSEHEERVVRDEVRNAVHIKDPPEGWWAAWLPVFDEISKVLATRPEIRKYEVDAWVEARRNLSARAEPPEGEE